MPLRDGMVHLYTEPITYMKYVLFYRFNSQFSCIIINVRYHIFNVNVVWWWEPSRTNKKCTSCFAWWLMVLYHGRESDESFFECYLYNISNESFFTFVSSILSILLLLVLCHDEAERLVKLFWWRNTKGVMVLLWRSWCVWHPI